MVCRLQTCRRDCQLDSPMERSSWTTFSMLHTVHHRVPSSNSATFSRTAHHDHSLTVMPLTSQVAIHVHSAGVISGASTCVILRRPTPAARAVTELICGHRSRLHRVRDAGMPPSFRSCSLSAAAGFDARFAESRTYGRPGWVPRAHGGSRMHGGSAWWTARAHFTTASRTERMPVRGSESVCLSLLVMVVSYV